MFANVFWKSDDEAVAADISVGGAPEFPIQHLTLHGGLGNDGHRAAVLDTTMSLSSLAPGSYVLRVYAHAANRDPALRELPFEVR